jgi:hypothetical protein
MCRSEKKATIESMTKETRTQWIAFLQLRRTNFFQGILQINQFEKPCLTTCRFSPLLLFPLSSSSTSTSRSLTRPLTWIPYIAYSKSHIALYTPSKKRSPQNLNLPQTEKTPDPDSTPTHSRTLKRSIATRGNFSTNERLSQDTSVVSPLTHLRFSSINLLSLAPEFA